MNVIKLPIPVWLLIQNCIQRYQTIYLKVLIGHLNAKNEFDMILREYSDIKDLSSQENNFYIFN